MEYLVTQAEMKQYDRNTIEKLKVPSVVLMERAALVTVEELRKVKNSTKYRVLIVAGTGNNGGDGLAVGRLLMLEGCEVEYVLLGNAAKCSVETALQLEILEKYGRKPYDRIPQGEYDIVIDAVFGVGLSRNVEGIYADAICTMNRLGAYICSVDIPSGIHADSGQILGCAVKADLTVTYGFTKLGEILYPGAEYCGKIICRQMGIDENGFFGNKPQWYTYTSIEDIDIPYRSPSGNKGTFGKAVVIAGSDTMCGAALMAGKSVFYMGAGMVRIITAYINRDIIQNALPEAMLTVYDTGLWEDGKPDPAFAKEFEEALKWADCILIGPGIGKGREAEWMLKYCLSESMLPMVIDADGLNILSEKQYLKEYPENGRELILTPHLGEFSRLYGCSIKEASENITRYPLELADKPGLTIVCKDSRTVVSGHGRKLCYINTSGNDGMATAGSGDVLAGMITGLLAQRMNSYDAAVTGVYMHGLAGDIAAGINGNHSMMATDIMEQIKELLKKCRKNDDERL